MYIYIYILFLLLGQVSLCCVSSHDIITSPLFTMMQSSADVDREVKLTLRTGGHSAGASARCFHGDTAVSSGRIARERLRDDGRPRTFSSFSTLKTRRQVRGREAVGRLGAMNVQTRRQQPQVQYPNAVIPPQNRVYPNRTARTSVPRPPRFPSRFKNVISPCSSEQFQP